MSNRPDKSVKGEVLKAVLVLLALLLAYFLLPTILQTSGKAGEGFGNHLVEKQEQRSKDKRHDTDR